MNRFVFVSVALLVISAVTASAIEDTTDPVGSYSFPVKAGRNTFTPGLVAEKIFHGIPSAVTTSGPESNAVFQVSGTSWTMGELMPHADGTPSHYVEVIPPAQTPAHPAVGLALDVIFNGPDSIAVDLNDTGLNAFQIIDGGGNPTPGLKICVRPHATLKSIFESAVSNITPFTDKVIILDENGAASQFVYNNFSGKWVDQYFTVADHRIVYPGQGIIFLVGGGADKDLVIGGPGLSHVKTTPTRVSLYAGVTNLIGQVNPLSGSTGTLGDLGFVDAFSGSSDMVDKVTVFQNPLGSGVTQYGKLFGNMINTVNFQNANNAPIRFSEAVKVFPITDTHIVLPPGF